MESVTVANLQTVLQTKKDIEKVLRGECRAYLPDERYLTIYFYRDCISGEAKVSDETVFEM